MGHVHTVPYIAGIALYDNPTVSKWILSDLRTSVILLGCG